MFFFLNFKTKWKGFLSWENRRALGHARFPLLLEAKHRKPKTTKRKRKCVCVWERERERERVKGIAHKETDKRIQNYKTAEEKGDTPLERERERARKCVWERGSVCERVSKSVRERERVCVAWVDAVDEAKGKNLSFFSWTSPQEEDPLRSPLSLSAHEWNFENKKKVVKKRKQKNITPRKLLKNEHFFWY